jgi:hypothetical protein
LAEKAQDLKTMSARDRRRLIEGLCSASSEVISRVEERLNAKAIGFRDLLELPPP